MNKGLVLGIIAVAVIVGGIVLMNSNSNNQEAVMVKESMEKDEVEKAQMLKDEALKQGEMNKNNEDAMIIEKDDIMKTASWTPEQMEAMKKEDASVMKKEAESVMKKEEPTMMKKDDPAMMSPGLYEPYAASKIAMASESKDVVLFFRASWCPFCKVVDADIKTNLKAIPSSLVILDVDYDNSADLKKKYGVTMQHTFVQVDAQGALIKKWSGSATLAAVAAEVQ